jgi:hypothetical protein
MLNLIGILRNFNNFLPGFKWKNEKIGEFALERSGSMGMKNR